MSSWIFMVVASSCRWFSHSLVFLSFRPTLILLNISLLSLQLLHYSSFLRHHHRHHPHWRLRMRNTHQSHRKGPTKSKTPALFGSAVFLLSSLCGSNKTENIKTRSWSSLKLSNQTLYRYIVITEEEKDKDRKYNQKMTSLWNQIKPNTNGSKFNIMTENCSTGSRQQVAFQTSVSNKMDTSDVPEFNPSNRPTVWCFSLRHQTLNPWKTTV